MKPRLLALTLALVAAASGCKPAPLVSARFRTLQRGTAFDRAVASTAANLGGVHQSDATTGVIRSKWTDGHAAMGIPPKFLWYRYQVLVLQNPADDSADVRISPEVVYCGILDSRDPDQMSNDCANAEDMAGAIIPGDVRDRIARGVKNVEADVFRRD